MSLVAGVTGGTVDYYPTRGGASYDPVLNGGSVTSMTVRSADGLTVMGTTTSVAKVADGRYRFTLATSIGSAGTYPTTFVWNATGSGPVVTDVDSVTVEAFGGAVTTSLCTLAEVKLQLNKTSTADDVELQAYIDAVTDVVEDYCGAVLPRTVTEWHTPRGGSIILGEERASSVQSVTEYLGTAATVYTEAADPSLAGVSSYMLDPALNGILNRIGSGGFTQAFTGPVKVVYTAGFATVPPALNLAARMIVQTMWRTQNGGAGLPQLSDEPLVDLPGVEPPIPLRAKVLLDRYRHGPRVA